MSSHLAEEEFEAGDGHRESVGEPQPCGPLIRSPQLHEVRGGNKMRGNLHDTPRINRTTCRVTSLLNQEQNLEFLSHEPGASSKPQQWHCPSGQGYGLDLWPWETLVTALNDTVALSF